MLHFKAVLGAALVVGSCWGSAARSEDRTFIYAVEHPLYGTIGTYSDEFHDAPDSLRVTSRLRIAVKILGIVMFREDSDRVELWRSGQLQSIAVNTVKNGTRLDVHGEIKNEGFIIETVTGRILAPIDIRPTDAWLIKTPGRAVVLSTRTGKVDNVQILGGESQTITFQGQPVSVRHYRVDTDSLPAKWEAWLDVDDVPIRFRSKEEGSTIDFNLVTRPISPGPQTGEAKSRTAR